MPVTFVDLAHDCAPTIAVETLAGIVSLESRFAPFNIHTNSGAALKEQPSSKAEAIEIATTLAAEHQDIQLGLGGIGLDDLQKLKLTISDAFDPCLNLRATAQLLNDHYRLAVRMGDDEARADKVMLQSFYGRGDPSIGAITQYDKQVQHEIQRLKPAMTKLTLGNLTADQSAKPAAATPDIVADVVAENSNPDTSSKPTVPSWDVFGARRHSSIIVFQNKHGAE